MFVIRIFNSIEFWNIKISNVKNVSISTLIIMFNFHLIFKIFEVINSVCSVYEIVKISYFSKIYVMIKNVDEIEILKMYVYQIEDVRTSN